MHDKHSEKSLMTNNFYTDSLFYVIRLFRQRLSEIDEVLDLFFM